MKTKTHRLDLVRDSLELLRQARAGIANDSNHSLRGAIDGAIVRMELFLAEGVDDQRSVIGILQVLAQGLAAIPGIQRLVDMLEKS